MKYGPRFSSAPRREVRRAALRPGHAPSRQTRPETATCAGDRPRRKAAIMSKPVKTEAELVAMARAELKAHLDCPEGIMIAVLRDGDSWEFRTEANEATKAKPGYPECVAMIVQIGDHLSKQFDAKE
jgi:hypothetical protein